jgi:hypothetical protein
MYIYIFVYDVYNTLNNLHEAVLPDMKLTEKNLFDDVLRCFKNKYPMNIAICV